MKNIKINFLSTILFFMLLLYSNKASAIFEITTYTTTYQSIKINWNPHIFPSSVTGYKVFYYDSANSGTGWIHAGNTGNTGKSFTVNNLISNHCYHIRVECHKNTGWIDTDETIGSICTNDSETQQARAPYNLIVSSIYANGASVKFAYYRPPNGMYVHRFEAYVKKETDNGYYLADTQSGLDFWGQPKTVIEPMRLSGLTPNTKYFVYMQVVYKSHDGFIQDLWQSSNPVNFITDPQCSPPKKFKKVACTSTSVTFEWEDDWNRPYTVRRSLLRLDGTWAPWVTFSNVNAISYDFTDLLTNRTYQFQVGYTCSGLNGTSYIAWNTPVKYKTIIPPPDNLYVNPYVNGNIFPFLSWYPVETGVKYNIYYKHSLSSTWLFAGSTYDNSYQIPLMPNTSNQSQPYEVRVQSELNGLVSIDYANTLWRPSFLFLGCSTCRSGSAGKTSATLDAEQTNTYKIAPNPVKNYFTISYNSDKEVNSTLYLYDTTGKMIHQEDLKFLNGGNRKEINTTSLQNGIYIVKIKNINTTNVETFKIIVQH